jgi:hypothetical protein
MTEWRESYALLYHITCETNAATRLSIPTTMQADGFRCQGHGSNPSQQVRLESPQKNGRQQQGRMTTTVPFLKQSSGNKKTNKTQQSITKTEAVGLFGCWKRHQCFEADRRGLGAG